MLHKQYYIKISLSFIVRGKKYFFLQIGDTLVRNESEAATWQTTIENALKRKLGFQINSGDQVSESEFHVNLIILEKNKRLE